MNHLLKILKWLFDPRELLKYENWIQGEKLGLRARKKFSTSKRKSKKRSSKRRG